MKHLSVLLILLSSISFSQRETEVFIPDNQFSFSVGVNLHQKVQIQTLIGETQFSSFGYPSPDIGVQYTKHILGPISGQIGFHFTNDMIGIRWEILNNDFLKNSSFDGELNDQSVTVLGAMYYIPILLQVNIIKKNNFVFTSSVGVKFNYFFPIDNSYFYDIAKNEGDTNSYNIFQMDLDYVNAGQKTWFPSYCIKLGATYSFKNRNTLTCNLQLNYTPSNIKEGTFSFFNITKPSSGTVQQRNNYVGIEFAYGFGKKRKIKPARYTLF